MTKRTHLRQRQHVPWACSACGEIYLVSFVRIEAICDSGYRDDVFFRRSGHLGLCSRMKCAYCGSIVIPRPLV